MHVDVCHFCLWLISDLSVWCSCSPVVLYCSRRPIHEVPVLQRLLSQAKAPGLLLHGSWEQAFVLYYRQRGHDRDSKGYVTNCLYWSEVGVHVLHLVMPSHVLSCHRNHALNCFASFPMPYMHAVWHSTYSFRCISFSGYPVEKFGLQSKLKVIP